jgi:hypothetical protein
MTRKNQSSDKGRAFKAIQNIYIRAEGMRRAQELPVYGKLYFVTGEELFLRKEKGKMRSTLPKIFSKPIYYNNRI